MTNLFLKATNSLCLSGNFDTDPIEPYLEDGWIKAKGTTLGADDGIGMATQLALLESKDLTRLMWESTDKFGLRFSSFDTGSAHNAIAREGAGIVLIPQDKTSAFESYITEMEKTIQKELHVTEPNVKLSLEKTDAPEYVVDEDAHFKLLNSLYACAHGVISWSQDIEDFVETSTNLAVVKTKEDHFFILHSHRSSVESAKENAKNTVAAAFRLAGAKIEHGYGYPGWAPNPDSEIVKLTAKSYEDLFEEKPEVLAIHAGLECGLIGEKYPGMDMISIGPEITGAHSPDEAIEVKSVEKFWDLTLDVLKRIK